MKPGSKEPLKCRHHHTAQVDKRGYLTYFSIGWPPVAGEFCYACQTYLWKEKTKERP